MLNCTHCSGQLQQWVSCLASFWKQQTSKSHETKLPCVSVCPYKWAHLLPLGLVFYTLCPDSPPASNSCSTYVGPLTYLPPPLVSLSMEYISMDMGNLPHNAQHCTFTGVHETLHGAKYFFTTMQFGSRSRQHLSLVVLCYDIVVQVLWPWNNKCVLHFHV